MKIWAAVLLGFMLGALLQPIPNLTAQVFGQHGINVHVRRVHGPNAADGGYPGSQVVGFSCVHEDDGTMCYVATRD